MKSALEGILLLIAAIFSGCSAVRSSTQNVVISATDPNAQIFADGQPLGIGVASASLKRNESHVFMAKTSDGRTGIATVGKSMSTTAILDMVGGLFFLLPLIGLITPGAWDLDSTTILINVPLSN